MTSLAKKSKKYAKLPTFVEIVDVLVAGFGVDKNSENALGKLAMFEHRSRLYNGSDVGGLRNFSKNSRNKSDEVAIYDKKIKNKGSMPFCVELDNLKDTDAPIHQPAAMLVAAD